MSISQKFFTETFDENGKLIDIEAQWTANFNFGYDVVDAVALETPDKRALVWCNVEGEEHIFTFADIRDCSNRAANVLLEAGIKKGDRVMLALKRHYEYWFISIALHKIGAVMIPVTHMLTENDLVYRMEAAKIRAVICTTLDGVPEKVRAAARQAAPDCILWTVKESRPGFENFTVACAIATSKLERIETKATDHMALYFTSGTSGNPKGVIHDYTYPLAHYVTARYWQQAEDGGLHFTISETGWAKASWGKLYGQWLAGSAVMVYDFDNFEPRKLMSVINHYGVTSFCAPSTVYRYLTRKNAVRAPGLKSACTAGEFLSPEVFEKFTEQTGLTLHEGYGQTETALLLANFKGEASKDGSLGKPSPLYETVLLDKQGNPVGDGEIGEVCVVPKGGKRPLGIFCAYLDNEEMYKYVWRGGVYHTGDAAWRDSDGYYWFHGRFDDIIKSGGFRIGPYEVEDVVIRHPAVAECSVIGVPDPMRGQAVKAVIVPAEGYEPSQELSREIRDFSNRRLAEYKWVRIVEFVDEMPKTISGKVRKAVQRGEKHEG